MTEQRFFVPNSEQRLRDAAIAYIEKWIMSLV
jgi:hypothetical protein